MLHTRTIRQQSIDLSGVVPAVYSQLTNLEVLRFAEMANVGGVLPKRLLRKLTKLTKLDLNGLPKCSSSIPAEVSARFTFIEA
jgi:hypothetical protein